MKKKGRNKEHYKVYKEQNRRAKNKLKRILRSNGLAAATDFAKKHQLRSDNLE